MRQIYTRILQLSVASAALLVAACVEELQTATDGSGHRTLRFEVAQDRNDSTPQSRTDAKAANPDTEVITLESDISSDTLFLHVTTGHGRPDATPATRGSCVTNDSFYDSFGVTAFAYSGAWSENPLPDFMYREELLKSTEWSTDHYWPGSDYKVRFFAVAPYTYTAVVHSDRTEGGSPTITYTSPAAATEQLDLLVAQTRELAGNGETDEGTIHLLFRHPLTAVKFVTGTDMLPGSIEEISLTGVYGTAVYTMDTETWSDLSGTKDFTYTPAGGIHADGSEDQELTSDETESVFFMIPQTLPDGACIRIIYTDDITGTRRVLSGNIGGTEWPAGQTVTYMISTSSIEVVPTFEVSQPTDWAYIGGSRTYNVKSYVTISRPGSNDGTVTQPVAWSAEFFAKDPDTGEFTVPLDGKPSWLTDFTSSGAGEDTELADGTDYRATVSAQIPYSHFKHDSLLLHAKPVEGIYDLSTRGGTEARTTANCYIVNAAGTYSLPLVYGNAIKDGATNESAYISQSTGEKILANFINHLGNPITDPYITRNTGCSATEARLLWQDAKNLITNVRLEGEDIVFDVEQENIRQGNAVIAVYNNGTVMWSWQIWVTDYDPDTEDAAKTLMSRLVGYCYTGLSVYDPREVMVRFTQEGYGLTQEIVLKSTGYEGVNQGYAPFYAFGSKNPRMPKYRYGAEAVIYDAEGTETGVSDTETAQEGNAFLTATATDVMANNCHTLKLSYINLWNNAYEGQASSSVVKTVYDPSPRGYVCIDRETYDNNLGMLSRFNAERTLLIYRTFEIAVPGYSPTNKDGGATINMSTPGYVQTNTVFTLLKHSDNDGSEWYNVTPGYNYCATVYSSRDFANLIELPLLYVRRTQVTTTVNPTSEWANSVSVTFGGNKYTLHCESADMELRIDENFSDSNAGQNKETNVYVNESYCREHYAWGSQLCMRE